MNEGFSKKEQSPWAVEPGSAVDLLEREQQFKRVTLENIRTDLRTFAQENNFSYEIEKGDEMLTLSVEQDYFSILFTHLKPLLREANELLVEHQKPFRIRLRIENAGFSIAFEQVK